MKFFMTARCARPPQVRNIRDTRGAGPAQGSQSLRFQIFSHTDFKFYDEIFYPINEYNGCRRKKRVPQNIHEFFTPRALGYWFMDDSYSFKNGGNRSYRFSTHSLHSFPLEDQEILVHALKDNLEI